GCAVVAGDGVAVEQPLESRLRRTVSYVRVEDDRNSTTGGSVAGADGHGGGAMGIDEQGDLVGCVLQKPTGAACRRGEDAIDLIPVREEIIGIGGTARAGVDAADVPLIAGIGTGIGGLGGEGDGCAHGCAGGRGGDGDGGSTGLRVVDVYAIRDPGMTEHVRGYSIINTRFAGGKARVDGRGQLVLDDAARGLTDVKITPDIPAHGFGIAAESRVCVQYGGALSGAAGPADQRIGVYIIDKERVIPIDPEIAC